MESNTGFLSKAEDMEKRADKIMKGSFLGNFMRGKQDRADEAKDIY